LKPVVNQIMQRYFFDFVGGGRAEFDFSGRVLPSAEKALRLAELIALDECSHGERIGWSVSVADAKGKGLRVMTRRNHHSAKGHAEEQEFVSRNCV